MNRETGKYPRNRDSIVPTGRFFLSHLHPGDESPGYSHRCPSRDSTKNWSISCDPGSNVGQAVSPAGFRIPCINARLKTSRQGCPKIARRFIAGNPNPNKISPAGTTLSYLISTPAMNRRAFLTDVPHGTRRRIGRSHVIRDRT
jgi:hypothetical protein